MKLLKVDKEHFLFEMDRREKQVLIELLKLYPVIDPSYGMTRGSGNPPATESQEILADALSDQRRENRSALEKLLEQKDRFTPRPNGWELRMTGAEMDWLLQILNDVRVGSWIALGSPDSMQPPAKNLTPAKTRSYWTMELCGQLQGAILQALNYPDPEPGAPPAEPAPDCEP